MFNIILAIVFALLGVLGLIYKVEVGVFIGFTLLPWQVIQVKKNKKISLISIIICSFVGSIFLIIIREWLLLVFFLFIQSYNYWGSINIVEEELDD